MMSPFRSLGFQKKIMLSYLVMMLLIGCVTTLFSYQMTKVTSDEMHLTQNVLPQASALLDVKNQLYLKTYALKMYTLTRQPSFLDQYYTNLVNSARFSSVPKTEENGELLTVIDLISQLDFIFLNKINPLLQAGNVTAVSYVLETDVQPKINELERHLTYSLNRLEYQTNKEFQKTNETLKVSLILTYSVSVASILFGLFCTFYFRRELLRPIRSLIEQVREVSKGTFGQQIVYDTKDEFHELAQEFNKMSTSIARLFQQDEARRQVLEEEKNVREQILNSLPVGVITRHFHSEWVHINQKAKELVRLDSSHFPMTKDPDLWSGGPGEQTPWFENRKISLYRENETPFTALVSYVPLRNQHDQEAGWMVAFSDITEQEQVQDYLHQSEKLAMVGQLAAGAAHEIRNPLTVIYGFIQLLQQRLPEEERDRHYLPLILQEIERVNHIVTELLMLSKPSEPNYREVSLTEVLHSILPLMKGEAALHGIEIVDLLEKDTRLEVDVEQLKQILLNLMKNSIEAMKHGGSLCIGSKVIDSTVQIRVADTGSGIPPEHLVRIFDPFFSLKEEGTGLGLPISRRMVENHGGSMQIFSEPGKGTEIVISLPLCRHGRA
ncbi:ATP-binding protein [Brevibacillus borstelensis]|jgi:two-component system sensor histidine kinase AtoS|nr:ATP-binding protein [Brevibacillus borstelensis]MCC0563900.1 HAMP domain-containing protein [Brevibacillus borstelensis]MCM3469987.1 ATP-binding protein [Brevibacillus borstelensis]MCM3558366.1 ATP-binding protein [Brevibacillus borstelensis]MCM3591049.1 ATP-binding protein [Brevibacillus borstelensis]MCM3624729.1 ATP-binding protein [Brevibacillus borstelensis]